MVGVEEGDGGQKSKTYLRNETIWQGNPDDASDEGRAAQEEEVPVETGRLLERELFRLSGDAAYILERLG